jgi:hypothetical protein
VKGLSIGLIQCERNCVHASLGPEKHWDYVLGVLDWMVVALNAPDMVNRAADPGNGIGIKPIVSAAISKTARQGIHQL